MRRSFLNARGFALIESLVALLLLATALLGMATTLLQAMSATREAMFQSRAMDLAADLSEQLKAARLDVDPQASRDLHVHQWQEQVARVLPLPATVQPARLQALVASDPLPASHEISISWRDPLRLIPQVLSLPILIRDH